jgi:adenine phosphoribosyltransferase
MTAPSDPVQVMRSLVRDVPDFPEPGIVYKDITPLLADAAGLEMAIEALAAPWADGGVDVIVGVEARGFILGAPVAHALGVGFVPARKAGKLPWETSSEAYGLEYGADVLEVHIDAVLPDQRVVVIDDVLATGATGRLVESVGGVLVGYGFLLELAVLEGRAKLGAHRIESIVIEID